MAAREGSARAVRPNLPNRLARRSTFLHPLPHLSIFADVCAGQSVASHRFETESHVSPGAIVRFLSCADSRNDGLDVGVEGQLAGKWLESGGKWSKVERDGTAVDLVG